MNSFEGVIIEDIIHCPNEYLPAGLKTKLYYVPTSFISIIDIPIVVNTYRDYIQLSKNAIDFRIGGWSYIDVLIEESELKQSLVGSLQRKKSKTELEFFVLGMNTDVLGFIETHKNTPMIFIVVDAIGNNWVIGNTKNRAFFDTIEVSSKKKYEENSGAALKIVSNSSIYYYGNSQEWIDQGIYNGDFSNEYSLEFFRYEQR